MGLTVVIGKKGSGKTCFALGVIADELSKSNRRIITNMEIYKEKLEQWFRDQGKEVDVAGRLIVLGAKDRRFARWWRIRGESEDDCYGPFGVDSRWDSCSGVLYVVDEGQHHYPARGWASRQRQVAGEPPMGEECNDYLCQERKTGDDTVVTTPSSSLLDKDFRTLSTECVVMDNWYRRRMKGFRASGRFQANIYENCPPQQGEEPSSQPHFHLDSRGLMGCYNTAAGAGFIGSRADMDKKPPRGIHWGWIVVGWLVVAFFIWLSMHYGLRGALGHLTNNMKKHEGLQAVQVPAVGSVGSTGLVAHAVASGELALPKESQEVVGICKGSLGWGVAWRDGYSTLAGSVQWIGGNSYLVDGARCRLVNGRVWTNPVPSVPLVSRARVSVSQAKPAEVGP